MEDDRNASTYIQDILEPADRYYSGIVLKKIGATCDKNTSLIQGSFVDFGVELKKCDI